MHCLPLNRSRFRLAIQVVTMFGLSALFGQAALAAPLEGQVNPRATSVVPTPVAPETVVPIGVEGTPASPSDDSSSARVPGAPAVPADDFVGRARDRAGEMVLTALDFLGVRYRRGGVSAESGFDCSGFTRTVFEHSLGLLLPRRAEEQARTPGLLRISEDDLKPGDLVFFNTLRRTFSHVGIYVGDGNFIHAPKPGGEVRVESMRTNYWSRRFTGGRRAEAESAPFEPRAAVSVAADRSAFYHLPAPSLR